MLMHSARGATRAFPPTCPGRACRSRCRSGSAGERDDDFFCAVRALAEREAVLRILARHHPADFLMDRRPDLAGVFRRKIQPVVLKDRPDDVHGPYPPARSDTV